jgi:hypothetical protein
MPYEVELANGSFIQVPNLETDSSNWIMYRANLLSAASVEGFATLYDGTETPPDPMTANDDKQRTWAQRNAEARCLIITTVPDSILFDIRTTKTACEAFIQLENLFGSPTTMTMTPPPSRSDVAPREAVRTTNAFGGTCWKCREVGHRVWDCKKVSNRSEMGIGHLPGHRRHRKRKRDIEDLQRVEAKGWRGERIAEKAGGQETTAKRLGDEATDDTTTGTILTAPVGNHKEDKGNSVNARRTSIMPHETQTASQAADDTTADVANLNATSAEPTRPEDVSYNLPDRLPSTPLEGRRTGASAKLSEVPNNDTTTSQSMWMLRDESPSREVHGVARSHEEAVGVDVEGGEVSDEDGKVETSTDETAAATSAPSQPSMPPDGREGQDTTGNTGASMHQLNGAQTASPRRHDGATTSVRKSAQSAGRADNTNADHQQRREDAHMEGRGGSGNGDVEGQGKVQGGGYEGGRGSSDGAAKTANDESR